jgi:hypothetical protein
MVLLSCLAAILLPLTPKTPFVTLLTSTFQARIRSLKVWFVMTIGRNKEHRAKVKLEIADRYENLARISGSKPKRDRYLRHVKVYRRQAVEIMREL